MANSPPATACCKKLVLPALLFVRSTAYIFILLILPVPVKPLASAKNLPLKLIAGLPLIVVAAGTGLEAAVPCVKWFALPLWSFQADTAPVVRVTPASALSQSFRFVFTPPGVCA